MQELQQLTQALKSLEDEICGCMRCGLCQSVCPLFAQTLNEADVARGKLSLLNGLASEMLKDADGVKQRLDKCLLCGSCAANCPSGVSALNIFMKARVILTAYQGLSQPKRLIFRGMLSHPRLFDNLLEIGTKFQSLFTTPASELLGTSCSKLMSPLIGNRHFTPLAEIPFHKRYSAKDTSSGKSGLKAAFYYGCLTDKVYPRIGEAVLKVLDHHGVGVFMPDNQACCGIPALASGDMKTFKELVQLNLKIFANGNFDVLVTPCASCTSTIKEYWTLFAKEFSAQDAEKIKAIAAKTMDISEFVSGKIGVKCDVLSVKNDERKRITYHDPCHLKKTLKISSQPRALIAANANYELVEMNEADYCCGCGGSFNLQHYETSKQIGNRKRDNIVASGADVVATSCPACMMQITDMLSQNKDNINVRHAIEVYAEQLAETSA